MFLSLICWFVVSMGKCCHRSDSLCRGSKFLVTVLRLLLWCFLACWTNCHFWRVPWCWASLSRFHLAKFSRPGVDWAWKFGISWGSDHARLAQDPPNQSLLNLTQKRLLAAKIQKHNQQRATASISVVSVSWMKLDDTGCHWMPLDATGCHWMPLARNQKPCTNSVNASALEHTEGLCAPITSSTSPYPLRSVILCPQILSWRNSPKPCLGSLLAKEMDDWPQPPLWSTKDVQMSITIPLVQHQTSLKDFHPFTRTVYAT